MAPTASCFSLSLIPQSHLPHRLDARCSFKPRVKRVANCGADQGPMNVAGFWGAKGGRASKKYVEEQVYDMQRAEFKKDIYHDKVANSSVERSKHDIAWAREKANQNHGYIKSGAGAVRGTWELSGKGESTIGRRVILQPRPVGGRQIREDHL